MPFTVTFLGTAAAVPSAERGLAGTVIQHDGKTVLVDCGEGTQRQMRRSAVGLVEVDAVLLTHLHGDHCLGLIGLLKSYDLLSRTKPLLVSGPVGLHAWAELISPLVGPLRFDVQLEQLTPGQQVTLAGSRLQLDSFATRHAVPSLGYRVAEPERPGRFDADRADELGLKPGPVFAALQRGEIVHTESGRAIAPEHVLGPARAGRCVVLTGDTEPTEATVQAAQGADLLVHEATFLVADRERARATTHSCAAEAAKIAQLAGVRRLALTHLSQRVRGHEVLAEARAGFADCFVPDDLDHYEVPLQP